ncbi:hypothetical protein DPMN_141053, partial [Dreissena polymorpha]
MAPDILIVAVVSVVLNGAKKQYALSFDFTKASMHYDFTKANDTTLYIIVDNPDDAANHLTTDLAKIHSWADK